MSDQVTEQPASGSPLTRVFGVLFSPGKTFEDVARSPGWITPLVLYIACMVIAFGFYGMKADWEAITIDTIESFPLFSMAPEAQQEEAIENALNTSVRPFSLWQLTATNAMNIVSFTFLFYHIMTLFYGTLFYIMGKIPDIRLGKAWLSLLLGLLAIGLQIGISAVAQSIAVDSRVYLVVAGTLVISAGYAWVLSRFTAKDIEFNKILSASTYSSAIGIVGAFALLLTAVATSDTIQIQAQNLVQSNVGAFVETGVGAIDSLLGSLDIFVIWFLIALTIGYSKVTKSTTGLAASIIFLPWVVWVLIKMAWAVAFG